MQDEKDQMNDEDKSPYSLTLVVIQNKLDVHLLDASTKYMYHHAFTAQELNECGFSDKQITNLDKILNFIATAKAGHNNLKFNISITKNENSEMMKECPFIAVITISKEDDFFGTMRFILKLKQIPRKQAEVNQDHIKDLKEENKSLKQEIQALTERFEKHSMPKGSIIMWSGSIKSIPKGWRLCDGTRNTPDLRNRFIIGAGSSYNVNSKGGNKSHSHNINVHGHSLTIDEIPSHQHEFYEDVWVCSHKSNHYICDERNKNTIFDEEELLNSDWDQSGDGNRRTKPTGGGRSHSHTASSSQKEHLPPYFAMAFIIKTI